MQCEKIHLRDYFPFLGENDCDPTVDIYLQDDLAFAALGKQEQKRPCLIICPGGGYRIVCPKESEPVALQFLPEGFQVFVLKYSTTPHCFPVQHREVAAVLELISKNAEQWHCNPEQVVLMGFSAGGHLAAHYANCYDHPRIREVFPDSKPVTASVLGYPVITASAEVAHRTSVTRFTGHSPLTEEDLCFFSCDKQVSPKTPPAFLWHCAGDKSVPITHSLLYARALAEHKIPVEMHIYPYGAHDLCTGDLQTNLSIKPEDRYVKDWLPAAKQFLQLILTK